MAMVPELVMRSLIEIHSLTCSFGGKRRSAEERMKLLGIENCDYEAYREMFLKSREKSHFITLTQDGWREIKHSWRKNDVLRHLTGEKTIGLFPALQIDYLMVDLDKHNAGDEVSLRSRAEGVIRVIKGDPLIYQSSFSGGIRLCFFLPKPLAREVLHTGCRKLLQEKKLIVKPGLIEILAGRKADRLPFGEGSYLVDPVTLEPICHLTPKETICGAYNVFQYQKTDAPFDIETAAEVPVPQLQECGIFDLVVGRLYEEGLYPEITTNEALLKMAWDLIIRKGYPKKEAERYLISWIRQKHNGLSNRVNAGEIDNVIRQIKRIIRSVDPSRARYSGSRYAVREKKLSLSDVRKIVLLTDDPKLRLAVFSLLEYCLCFGKRYSGREKNEVKISNLYRSENGYVTYRSGFQDNFYCEISKKTLQCLSGFDKANPQITMRKIEELGVPSLKRRAHPQSHHCRQYWVNFPFDEEDPVKIVSLDEGVAKLNRVNLKKCGTENREIKLLKH